MDQPVEKPDSTLPTYTIMKNPIFEENRMEREITNQPIRPGTPPMIRAACRPRESAKGQARKTPKMAPIGIRPYILDYTAPS